MTTLIDYEQKCRDELDSLEKQDQRISQLKKEISRLKLEKKVTTKEVTTQSRTAYIQNEQPQDDSFEDEINYYFGSYRQLYEDFSETDIKVILPRKKNSRYKDILLRLSLESIKEIKEVKEILRDEDISEEEKELCNKIIETETKKIDYIKSKLIKSEKEEIEQEEKNNIVLVPTLAGNIRVLDDLEHIPSEYYEGFKELIDSIVDGSFKNVKMFVSNSQLFGISEVKAFKIRVVFTRLNPNTYAIITAFVKKSDKDKLYAESLSGKVREYRTLEPRLKDNLNNPEFLEENEKSVQELFNLISPKEDIKRKEI